LSKYGHGIGSNYECHFKFLLDDGYGSRQPVAHRDPRWTFTLGPSL